MSPEARVRKLFDFTVPDEQKPLAVTALLALARHGVPPDVQELLVHGNPALGLPPGALAKAVSAVIREVVA